MTITGRSAAAAVALLVSVGVLAGCGADGDEEDDVVTPVGRGTDERVDATFEVDVVPDPDAGRLRISYRWVNDSAEPVLVVNRPLDYTSTGRTGRPSPTAWYAVGLGDGRAQVAQRVFERPDTETGYAAPFEVGVTLVQPGGEVSSRLEVPLPLTEAKPFLDEYADGEATVGTPSEVEFCLGALVPPYDPRLTEQTENGLISFHGSTELQTLFCSEPVALG